MASRPPHAAPPLSAATIDIFEHSPYFADDLLRYSELLDELCEPFQLEGGSLEDGATLRRFYRRQMLRIQSESILRAPKIFSTLRKTSVLADSGIAAAYQIAVREAIIKLGVTYETWFGRGILDSATIVAVSVR